MYGNAQPRNNKHDNYTLATLGYNLLGTLGSNLLGTLGSNLLGTLGSYLLGMNE